ncbi:MAG: TIGR03905 family TSCPD domain-containing protein [Clostridia bacterium]|nr:TIGR03905 family TSCPD domain-containing protein [Clostridia bacterium]
MSQKFTYKTRGVCSRNIHFELEDGKVHNVKFDGGCRGNTQGLSALAEGMEATELVARLEGTQCRGGTSCPDQLAKAVKEALSLS